MLILLVMMLAGFAATVAFSVDVAQRHYQLTGQQVTADLAAHTAWVEFVENKRADTAIQTARYIASENRADGIINADSEINIELGTLTRSDGGSTRFSAETESPNAARVGYTTSPIVGIDLESVPYLRVLANDTMETSGASIATQFGRDIVLLVTHQGGSDADRSPMAWCPGVIQSTLKQTEWLTPANRIGLAVSGPSSVQTVRLGGEREALLRQAATFSWSFESPSDLGRALAEAAEMLTARPSHPERGRRLIWVGQADSIDSSAIQQSIAALNERAVRIDCIELAPKTEDSSMRTIAEAGGGRYHAAHSAIELGDALRSALRPAVVLLRQ